MPTSGDPLGPEREESEPSADNGDTPAVKPPVDELVAANITLVERMVGGMAGSWPRHVDREELIAAGKLGLVEAAQRWDPSRGIPFDRFATTRVRGAVLDAARAADWAPRAVRRTAREIDATRLRLTSTLGREPTDTELAAEMQLSQEELARTAASVTRSVIVSLERRPLDNGLTLAERTADSAASGPDELAESRELREQLRAAVELLPERHRLVVIGVFLEGRSGDDLAALLGVSPSRISQLRGEALEMLRVVLDAANGDPGETMQHLSRRRVERLKAASAVLLRRSNQAARRNET